MRRVFMSFLGLGAWDEKRKVNDYQQSSYRFDLGEAVSSETKFVQRAQLELLGAERFDCVVIFATEKSANAHFDSLSKELNEIGCRNIKLVEISQEMTPEDQWSWFETILKQVDLRDTLTVDLTHGFRSVPIVFSAAINFLQKSKNINLQGVYYGVYEKDKTSRIVDLRQFYYVNEWADAVSRLVEEADARKMTEIAEHSPDFQASSLKNPEFIKALDTLTNALRNVEVNHVAKHAGQALKLVDRMREDSSPSAGLLLDLVLDKFAALSVEESRGEKYDKEYFRVQLEISRLLLDHKLYMQAYTVMREFIGSIGMLGINDAKVNSQKGRKKRRRFAETFINMMQHKREEWRFEDGDEDRDLETLMPFYRRLEEKGIEGELRKIVKELIDFRNGFDHAWTSKAKAHEDIKQKGDHFYGVLNNVLERLIEESLVS